MHEATRHYLTSFGKALAAFLRTSGAILGTRLQYSPVSHRMLPLAIGNFGESCRVKI